MTEEQFDAALAQQGLSEAQYRRDLKRQLLHLKVMNERVRGRVNVTFAPRLDFGRTSQGRRRCLV